MKRAALDFWLLHLIGLVIGAYDQQPSHSASHSPPATIRAVAALQRFLRDGTFWRGLTASVDQASDATLRWCLAHWNRAGLLTKVRAVLVGMLLGHSNLILDSCSVGAKRGSDLIGPNLTDRNKQGIKYHTAVDRNGVPIACLATAANLSDALVFEWLLLAAFAVMARIRTVFAYRDYDAKPHRYVCRTFGTEPSQMRSTERSRLGMHR